MKISMMAAVAANGVIGKDNDIPWAGKAKGEQKIFKRMTRGKVVVMGRNTWESIPSKFRPLPGRFNIVLTSKPKPAHDHIELKSLEDAILFSECLKDYGEIVLMGGHRVYKEGLELCDTLYLTEVEGIFPGDVFFPKLDENQWVVREEEYYPQDETKGREVAFRFKLMDRIK